MKQQAQLRARRILKASLLSVNRGASEGCQGLLLIKFSASVDRFAQYVKHEQIAL